LQQPRWIWKESDSWQESKEWTLQYRDYFACPLKKYTGFIARRKKKGGAMSYVAVIRYKSLYLSKSFNTEANSDKYICNTNVREGLLIKNRFTVFVNRALVELSGDKLLITDNDNLYLVELHTWHCTSNGYAATHTSGSLSLQYFHNIAMKHIPNAISINHINLHRLDNHKNNLRLVNKMTQSINQSINSNNKSGVIGVFHDNKSEAWVSLWKDADGNSFKKYFSSNKCSDAEAKAMAIAHCQRIIRPLPHYVEALRLNVNDQ